MQQYTGQFLNFYYQYKGKKWKVDLFTTSAHGQECDKPRSACIRWLLIISAIRYHPCMVSCICSFINSRTLLQSEVTSTISIDIYFVRGIGKILDVESEMERVISSRRRQGAIIWLKWGFSLQYGHLFATHLQIGISRVLKALKAGLIAADREGAAELKLWI